METKYTFEIRAQHPLIDKELKPINDVYKNMTGEEIIADFGLAEVSATTKNELTKEEIDEYRDVIKTAMEDTLKKHKMDFVISKVVLVNTEKVDITKEEETIKKEETV